MTSYLSSFGLKMDSLTLDSLKQKLIEKRGTRGIREVAEEIQVSASTLSRVERGFLPDLETFAKICKWLSVDPGEVLGIKPSEEIKNITVHFRKNREISPKTAKSLTVMIQHAYRAFSVSDEI